MSLNLRYWNEFRSVRGDLYRVEILCEDDGAETPAERISLSYDEAAEIEWKEVDKIEPVQSSVLTLTLDSDTDRRFLNLYTIEVGAVRADVFRNGVLYWSGTLDPELYEEPFSFKQDYDVSVSFSDFAILDRLPWDGRGLYSVREVIDRCLAAAGIRFSALELHISTRLTANGEPLTLDEVHITGENLYDEEDEPMTMREVLDEVLRPFALRLVQKAGTIHILDLNSLHAETAQPVIWADVDAQLEADSVYNNVKVTFSPYASGQLVDGSLDYDTVLNNAKKIDTVNIRTDRRTDSPEGFTIEYDADPPSEGFTSKRNDLGNLFLHDGAVACRITSAFSGSNEAAILWGCRPDLYWYNNVGIEQINRYNTLLKVKSIIETKPFFLPTVKDSKKFRLKVTFDVLIDVRYNPFEDASDENESGNWNRLQKWANYAYIPFSLFLTDIDSHYLYKYVNRGSVVNSGYGEHGSWHAPFINDGSHKYINADSWLSYYSKSDRKGASGLGRWTTNRQSIGIYDGKLPSAMDKLDDGLYIGLPPVSGYLELYIGRDADFHKYSYDNDDIASRLRWIVYKNPKIEIVKSNGLSIDQNDIEDTAWINRAAKETLEIDTIFGTMPESVPSARGLLFDASGNVYETFSRAGHTDRLERLLIGTVYSQYARRNHVLSGTAELLPDFGVLTDRSEPGQYILLNEIQHLMTDESEIKMVQFDADNYSAIEYK